MNILFNTGDDIEEADVSDAEAGSKSELTNGVREAELSPQVTSEASDTRDVRPSVPTSSGAGSSQAWGGARPKTTRTRPRNTETTTSTSSSSARTRNSESVEIRVLPCDQLSGQQPPSDQEFPSSLHSDLLIPRLESLPHISSSASRDTDPDTGEDECYVYTYIGGTAYLSADLPNSFFR